MNSLRKLSTLFIIIIIIIHIIQAEAMHFFPCNNVIKILH